MSLFAALFVSDICGKVGRQAAAYMIKPMREKHGVDYVIANVENAAGGFGMVFLLLTVLAVMVSAGAKLIARAEKGKTEG